MVDRSPNFPSMSLGDAIEATRAVYQREGRSKMPRLSVVKPLGYTSINGRSLSVLGALKAYGLLDGRGDELRITDDGITIISAPQNSRDRQDALTRAFEAPAAFNLLRSQGSDASPETLRWHLVKSNFREDAADKLLRVYLDSRELVNSALPEYGAGSNADGEAVQSEVPESVITSATPSPVPSVAPRAEPDFKIKLGNEIEAFIWITGAYQPRHLTKLIKFLTLQRELLEDADEDEAEQTADDLLG